MAREPARHDARQGDAVTGTSSEYNKRYRERHPERFRESQRKWREKNRESELAKARTRAARRYAADPDTHREAARARRLCDPEAARASVRRYRVAHPDVQARHDRLRRARLLGTASDGHTRAEVFERDGGICQLCSTPLDPTNWHEDHVIPLSRGGSDLISNCQATCPPCNLSKGARVA